MTPAEKLAWERQCYGMTEADMRKSLEHQAKLVGWPMLAMSILSDGQEAMVNYSHGQEYARQFMNKAKWIIGAHLVDAHLLATALPYVEDAEKDPAFKPGVVKAHSAAIRDALERLR